MVPDITTYHTHGVNALLMLMDVTLSRYPYQLKHFPAPLSFIMTYLIFNRIYYAETSVVVHPSLNYGKNLGLALAMIAATILALLPGTHLLLWRHELACFSLSERLRRRRHAQAAAQEADGVVKKGTAGTGAPQLELSNAVLARRWMGEVDDDEAVVQTPTTTGSAASPAGRDEDDGVDVEAAAPTGVIGA